MNTRRTPFVALCGAALAAFLLAGCNQAGTGQGAAPTASPGDVVTPSQPGPSHPILPSTGIPTKNPPGTNPTTLTGTVERSEVEGGCTVLRVGDQTYQLMGGDQAVLRVGNRVTVEGRVNPNVATICQVGPVFEVSSARPA